MNGGPILSPHNYVQFYVFIMIPLYIFIFLAFLA